MAAVALSWQPSPMVAAAVYGAIAIGLLARRPRLMVPALMLMGALAPSSLRAGGGGRINAAMLVVAAFIGAEIVRMLVRREIHVRPSPANRPWLALVVVAGVSIAAGGALWNPWVVVKDNYWLVQFSQWSLYILAAGAYVFGGTQLDQRDQLRTLMGVVLFLGVLRLGSWLSLEPYVWRLGILGGPVIRIWIVAVAAASALFIPTLDRRVRFALLGLAAFTVGWPFLYFRDWASGWAPSTVCAGIIGLLWGWRRSVRPDGFLILAGMMAAPIIYILSRVTAVGDAWSVDTRLIAFRGLVGLLEGRWLMGLGLAAYWHYWRDVFGEISYVDPRTGDAHYTFAPMVNMHNNYLDVLGQMGLLGLATFLWLLAALAYQGLRTFRAEPPGLGRAYAAACVGGLAGMAFSGVLGDWIIPFVYNIGLNGFRDSFIGWLLLGGLTLLDNTREESSTVAEAGGTMAAPPIAPPPSVAEPPPSS